MTADIRVVLPTRIAQDLIVRFAWEMHSWHVEI